MERGCSTEASLPDIVGRQSRTSARRVQTGDRHVSGAHCCKLRTRHTYQVERRVAVEWEEMIRKQCQCNAVGDGVGQGIAGKEDISASRGGEMVEQFSVREIHRIGCWKASPVLPFLLLTTLGLLGPATYGRHSCRYLGK